MRPDPKVVENFGEPMRLRSDFYVAALMRRAMTSGAHAYLRRRGSDEAGAIFIQVERRDGLCALFGPAPQSAIVEDGLRRFERCHDGLWIERESAAQKLERELRFDSDLWIVDIEDEDGRPFAVPG